MKHPTGPIQRVAADGNVGAFFVGPDRIKPWILRPAVYEPISWNSHADSVRPTVCGRMATGSGCICQLMIPFGRKHWYKQRYAPERTGTRDASTPIGLRHVLTTGAEVDQRRTAGGPCRPLRQALRWLGTWMNIPIVVACMDSPSNPFKANLRDHEGNHWSRTAAQTASRWPEGRR